VGTVLGSVFLFQRYYRMNAVLERTIRDQALIERASALRADAAAAAAASAAKRNPHAATKPTTDGHDSAASPAVPPPDARARA
jgi:hypothetical protein